MFLFCFSSITVILTFANEFRIGLYGLYSSISFILFCWSDADSSNHTHIGNVCFWLVTELAQCLAIWSEYTLYCILASGQVYCLYWTSSHYSSQTGWVLPPTSWACLFMVIEASTALLLTWHWFRTSYTWLSLSVKDSIFTNLFTSMDFLWVTSWTSHVRYSSSHRVWLALVLFLCWVYFMLCAIKYTSSYTDWLQCV